MIRRPPRSTRVRSSAASDVYKRQVHDDIEICRTVDVGKDECQPTEVAHHSDGPLRFLLAGLQILSALRIHSLVFGQSGEALSRCEGVVYLMRETSQYFRQDVGCLRYG